MRYFNRKKISLTLSAAIAAAWIPLTPATSFAVTVGDYDYSIAGKTATLLGCSDVCPASLSIPKTVPGTSASVVSIGENAFLTFSSDPATFSGVSLPSTVTTIESNAFSGVVINGPLVLPANLIRIESRAFYETTVVSVSFGTALNYIGQGAFQNATITGSLPTLSMQSGEIQTAAFSGVSFDEITLGANFSSVGVAAFAKPFMSDLEPKIDELTINGGNIAVGAFQNTDFDKLTLGSKIGTIGSGAFAGPTFDPPIERGELNVNSGIIDQGAFSNSSFSTVTIGKSVSSVGSGAFGSSSSPYPTLGSVSVDARVLSQGAFMGASMASLTLGTNIATIGSGSFGGNLESFNLGAVTIKGGSFSSGAFHGIEATSVNITSTVKRIGYSAFNDAVLGNLTINSQFIDDSAFYDTEATKVVFGSNVKSVGDSAFGSFEITGASKVITLNAEVIESNAFYDSNITGLTLGSKVQRIGDSAFASSDNLESVVINSGKIGSSAFWGSGVKNLVIGSGVTRIGESAFLNTNLDSLDIASGLTTIEESAFTGIGGNLSTIRIPNSVVTIGESAFNSAGLESVYLGSGLRYLEENAFMQNEDLAEISFYGPPPTGSSAFPLQIMNVHHTSAHDVAWAAAFTANPDWNVPPISRVSGLPKSTLTYTSASNDKPTARKVTIKANYSMSAAGKVQLTVTKSGSNTVLCAKTVTTRNLSGATGIATCDLSKKVRDGLKKKALTLNVKLTYSPDLGSSTTMPKTLLIKKG